MPEMADVLRRYGREYLDQFGEELLPSHRRAIAELLACRTETLGGHLYQCDHCGSEHDVYHSCRNRSCPKCHDHAAEAWLEERRQELLPVSYFHVVFTLPQELRALVRGPERDLSDILLRAAAQALIKLAADPQYVGGLIGVLCVLHTWTRALVYHPPVHCLVPAGGVSSDRTQWQPARQTYLVPVRALSKLFRGLFRDLVHQECPDLNIPEPVWTTAWVVYCQPTVQGAEQVLRYLGRYVYRIALTNNRILCIDDGQVRFRDQDSQLHRWKTMALPAQEFIRRFLQHALPQGFHKVRYYGLWSPANRTLLHRVQLGLASLTPTPYPAAPEPATCPDDSGPPPLREGQTCPHCGHGLLALIRTMPRLQRGPP